MLSPYSVEPSFWAETHQGKTERKEIFHQPNFRLKTVFCHFSKSDKKNVKRSRNTQSLKKLQQFILMLPTDQIMLKEKRGKGLKTQNKYKSSTLRQHTSFTLQDIAIKHFGTRSARFNLVSVLYLQRNVLAYS